MERWHCDSQLTIRIKQQGGRQTINVHIEHAIPHKIYYDVDLPVEVAELIAKNLWMTPSLIAVNIQKKFPHITTAQVRDAWAKMSNKEWKRDEDQIESTKLLLAEHSDDVDVLEMDPVEGVTAIAWGVKGVVAQLKDVVEVAMDATCTCMCPFALALANDLCQTILIKSHWNSMPLWRSKTTLAYQ